MSSTGIKFCWEATKSFAMDKALSPNSMKDIMSFGSEDGEKSTMKSPQ